MNICKKCGCLINDKEKFCTHCGAENEKYKETLLESRKESKMNQERENDPKKYLILGILALGIAGFLILAYLESMLMFGSLFDSIGSSDPEKAQKLFNMIEGIVYIVFSVPSMIMGIYGGIKGTSKASKIVSAFAVATAIGLVVLVSCTAFK